MFHLCHALKTFPGCPCNASINVLCGKNSKRVISILFNRTGLDLQYFSYVSIFRDIKGISMPQKRDKTVRGSELAVRLQGAIFCTRNAVKFFTGK